ncbi:MAG: cyclopropane-fatty-acyl-phospholipid synthase family protein [Acidaminococcus provencensis]|nr:cyclopropane-fatty-acyl-phospholipid synthase family protein [Acidaminococcus provencensis]MCH4097233.1 cyclopropane-fatty-acyl-phospholipid synthase family protein [Acidaminococcus provencensis]
MLCGICWLEVACRTQKDFKSIEMKAIAVNMHLMDDFMAYYLQRFDKYCFELDLKGKTYTIGTGKPLFRIIIHKDVPKKELVTSTTMALGEAYMRGDIEVDGDLFTVLKCLLEQMDRFSLDRKAVNHLLYPSEDKSTQREEVCSHYDLGNEFYEQWLDPTLSYSCAYFKNPDDTLEQAQKNKVHYILEKLHLEKGMSLLDIGCGWGYLLLEAAKLYGVRGYGCTLSKEQWAMGQKRIKELGLEGQVRIELLDYRDLPKKGLTFDRVVSVGMLEHVGRSHYEQYMTVVDQVLKEGGLFLLHFINGRDQINSNPWMRKYIFPGGTLPTIYEIIELGDKGPFQLLDAESLRRHYAKTLQCWNANFQKVKAKIAAHRGEDFVRMWELYLCGCAAAFYIGYIDVHQLLFTKGTNNDLPMTRWY